MWFTAFRVCTSVLGLKIHFVLLHFVLFRFSRRCLKHICGWFFWGFFLYCCPIPRFFVTSLIDKKSYCCSGHLRDPNNQIVVVKGLRISVTGVNTRPAHSTELHRLLSQAVSACQPPDGPAANVITAGDYDLNISGESERE